MGRHRELRLSHATVLRRVFRTTKRHYQETIQIDLVFEFTLPEALNRCFLKWVETLVTKTRGEIIPIDGKAIKGSYDRNQGKSALHVITAQVL